MRTVDEYQASRELAGHNPITDVWPHEVLSYTHQWDGGEGVKPHGVALVQLVADTPTPYVVWTLVADDDWTWFAQTGDYYNAYVLAETRYEQRRWTSPTAPAGGRYAHRDPSGSSEWFTCCEWCAGRGCQSCGWTGRADERVPLDPWAMVETLANVVLLMEAAFSLTVGRGPTWLRLEDTIIDSDVGVMSLSAFRGHYQPEGADRG